MKRRSFLSALAGLGVVAVPPAIVGRGVAAVPAPLVLFLDDVEGPQGPRLEEFRTALRTEGLAARMRMPVVGVDASNAASCEATLRASVAMRPRAFVTASADVARRAKAFADAVPLVFATLWDPAELGLLQSTGGRRLDVTGFTYDAPIDAKAVEALRDAFPSVRRVGVLADRLWAAQFARRGEAALLHDRLGLRLEVFAFDVPGAATRAVVEKARALDCDAWFVPRSDLVFAVEPKALIALFAAQRKPHLFGTERLVREGALMSYGFQMNSHWASLAAMVRLVLDGVPARDIPIEHPKDFVLAINVTRGRELGLAFSKAILKRATLVV